MNHIVLIGHGKMGSALAKGWVKENSKYKISIIEQEELLLNYKKFTNVKVYKNFNEFFIFFFIELIFLEPFCTKGYNC